MTTTKEPLKIVELRAENVKRLSAVQVRPDGSLVTVSGPNGAGKSSLIDSIMYGLGGARVRPSRPVREGAPSAEVEIDLGAYRIKRVIRDSRPDTLEVRAADGQRYASPQAVLDKIVGDLTFDPLAFTRRKPTEQAEILRQLAGIDLSDVDAAEKEAFERRTIQNRELKNAQAQLDVFPIDPEAPATEEEASGLRERMVEATRARERMAAAQRTLKVHDEQIRRLKEQLANLEEDRVRIVESMDGLQSAVDGSGDPDELVARLREIDQRNARARKAAERRAIEERVELAAYEVSLLDDEVKARRAERSRRIEAATMPLPGLSLGEGEVLLNGVPLEQASQAEQIRAATAIGMALNPRLRVVLIRDGSLLDKKALAELAEQAESNGYQVWIERVAEPGQGVGIVIEDGSLVGAQSHSEPANATTNA